MLIWKVQNPWTGLRGQLYDCFLEPTGGLYGCMLALEPLHIQLNLETAKIEIINSSQSDHERLCIRASVLRSGGSGEEIIYAQDNILVEANRKWCSTKIPTADLKGAVLLFMDLFQEKHGQGEVGNGNYADQNKCNHSSVGKSSGSSWEVWLPIGIYQKATGTAEELINTKIKVADGWSALMPSINQTDHISRNIYWQPEELFKTSTPTCKIGCGQNIFAGVSQRMGIGSIQASPICPAADFRVFKQWLHSSSVTPSTGESFQLDFEVSPFFGAIYNSDSLSNNSTTSGSIVQITNSHTDKYAMWVRVDVKVIKCDVGDRQSVTDLAAEPSVSGDKEEESKAQHQNIIGNDIINHNISDADAVFMAEFFPVIKPGEIINIYIMKHSQCCGQQQHFQNHQGPNTAPLLKVVISGLNIARSEICI
uniref:Uncharacterized protein n=2 Tax=Heterosigma akashiwo TaxID=2829 RepID=A0A7S3XTN5_HETAK